MSLDWILVIAVQQIKKITQDTKKGTQMLTKTDTYMNICLKKRPSNPIQIGSSKIQFLPGRVILTCIWRGAQKYQKNTQTMNIYPNRPFKLTPKKIINVSKKYLSKTSFKKAIRCISKNWSDYDPHLEGSQKIPTLTPKMILWSKTCSNIGIIQHSWHSSKNWSDFL